MPDRSYAAAEKYILSREFFGMKLGLENITEFLRSIGQPQSDYATIHISGTNGKGSVAAMLAAILQAQGYKTGLFTSPHLVSLRERVRVDGRMIPKQSVTSFVNRYRKVLSKRKLSFFELVTALALQHFSRAGVDIAVIETGLGGRLDASNVLAPELTITTDISRDHVEVLGSTIPKIAGEKAGIIKQSVPHLIGIMPPSAERVFRRRCRHLGAPFHRLNRRDFKTYPELMKLDFSHNGLSVSGLKPALPGTHQLRNTALVLKAVSVLRERGRRISKRAMVEGIAATVWPGRFQIVRDGRGPIHVLDVSHNAAGVACFVETFRLLYPGKKARIITGFVKRKEHQRMFNDLSRIADSYALVPLRTGRSTDIDDLAASIDWRGIQPEKYRTLKTAHKKVVNRCRDDDVVVIIGSHYLVGEFISTFGTQ
ncbi:MAG: bifunctional folylpolyglutamate synthase/dihydrofolate synthase [Candidatus Zixiibacteriota bacterium]|nr:MAG: bifunctional folylpolyglutamate synthase/dihydrofolate synthase [candidate division Zixibacteria bacterium]